MPVNAAPGKSPLSGQQDKLAKLLGDGDTWHADARDVGDGHLKQQEQ